MEKYLRFTKREFCATALGLPLSTLFGGEALAQVSDTLSIAFPVDVQSWDPTSVTFPAGQSIYKCVFDSPMHYSTDQKLQPKQIKDRKWLDEANTRLEITLQDGILFHDGSQLTMEDVRYSWIERPQKDRRLAIGGMIPDMNDIQIVSPTKGVIIFSKPAPSVEYYLGFLAAYIIPKAYHLRVGNEGFLEKPIGAGPYKLVDYQRGSRIVLEAFDRYWAGVPSIKKVTFQILPEPTARVAAIESGRVDIATQLPFREAVRLSSNSNLTSDIYDLSEVFLLQVPSYVEIYKNKDVRAALHLSIDKQALSKSFFNGVAKPLSVLATSGSSSDVPGYNFPYDKARAIASLKKAGYDSAKPLQITLQATNGTYPNDYLIARALVAMWKQVGINATLSEITIAKYLELNHSQKLDGVMLYSWANPTGDPENFAGRILNPDLRFAAWRDAALAPRIAELYAMKLTPQRIEAYKKLQIEASENSWSIPLLQTVGNVVSKKGIAVPKYAAGYILPAEFARRR